MIFEAVILPLPLTLAPPANVMVTVPPLTVAGLAPYVKSEENTLAAITWYVRIEANVLGSAC